MNEKRLLRDLTIKISITYTPIRRSVKMKEKSKVLFILALLLTMIMLTSNPVFASTEPLRVVNSSFYEDGRIEIEFNRDLDTGHTLINSKFSVYASIMAGHWQPPITSITYDGNRKVVIQVTIPAGKTQYGANESIEAHIFPGAVIDISGNEFGGDQITPTNQVTPYYLDISMSVNGGSSSSVTDMILYENGTGSNPTIDLTFTVLNEQGGTPVEGLALHIYGLVNQNYTSIAQATTDSNGKATFTNVSVNEDFKYFRGFNIVDMPIVFIPSDYSILELKLNASTHSLASKAYDLSGNSHGVNNILKYHALFHHRHYFVLRNNMAELELIITNENLSTNPLERKVLCNRVSLSLQPNQINRADVDIRDESQYTVLSKDREASGSTLLNMTEINIINASNNAESNKFQFSFPVLLDKDIEIWIPNNKAHPTMNMVLLGDINTGDKGLYLHLLPDPVNRGVRTAMQFSGSTDRSKIYAINQPTFPYGLVIYDYPTIAFYKNHEMAANIQLLLYPYYPYWEPFERKTIYHIAEPSSNVMALPYLSNTIIQDASNYYYYTQAWQNTSQLPIEPQIGGDLKLDLDKTSIAKGETTHFSFITNDGYRLTRILNFVTGDTPITVQIKHGDTIVDTIQGTTWTVPAYAEVGSYTAEIVNAANIPLDTINKKADFTVTENFSVTYDGNGHTEGMVPVDSNDYKQGDNVTILGNTGNLVKPGYTFGGWNTESDGQGTNYLAGLTFTMGTENVSLFAKWIDSASIRMTANPDNVKGSTNFNQTFILNLYNDTVTGSVYASDIHLGSVFSTLNIDSISNNSDTVTLAVYGSLNTQGIGTIALNQNKLNNSTTPLVAEVFVSLNTLTYHGNGNTGGSVPTDSNGYEEGATATVLGNTGNLVKAGYIFTGWNTQANGQGTNYTQGSTLIMGTTNLNLYAMWRAIPSGGDSPGGGSGGGTKPAATPSTETGVVVIVNGKAQAAGKQTVIEKDGEKILELRTDSDILSQKIDEVIAQNRVEGRQGQNLVEIQVIDQGASQIRSVLTGDIVKKMEDNQFTLIINTEKVDYIIPASEIDIANIAAILNVDPSSLHQIEIELRITYSNQAIVDEITQRGIAQGIEVIMQPVAFQIIARTTSNTGEVQEATVNQFTSYVSRVMEVPPGVDPNKLTTGVLYNSDGTFVHIPTNVFRQDNKWYAELNSLTNSTYAVIWNPVTVASVDQHWSKDIVNDMASRLVIKNPQTFEPNGYITRGEFAEYITKALGVYRTNTVITSKFADVTAANELAAAITIATDYGILQGYPDGTFKPNAKITREEAMTMYAKVMDIVGLTTIDESRIDNYQDEALISDWAYKHVKKVVSARVFNGKTTETIGPKETFTYAEAATAIRNLLIKAELINK